MPRRDLFDDAPRLQFVRDLASSPLADGTPGISRRFAGQSGNLTALLSGKLGWGSWARRILQALDNREGLPADPLQSYPAIPPQAHRIHIDR